MSTVQQIDRVRTLLREALDGVRAELDKCRSGAPAVDSEEKLSWVASGLQEMLHGLDQADRPEAPGLWYVVTDTWPYKDPLGDKVVEAEHAYKRLK